MEKKREEFIRLPVLYESWPRLKDDLQAIASKTALGLEALEKLLEKNEGGTVGLSLLNKVLSQDQTFTMDLFCNEQLPWLAVKALQVEELFKDSEYKIQNLYTGREGEVVLTRQQICTLMSLAFFNCFEKPAGNYQEFTFLGFLSFAMYASQGNKLKCLLNYFERVRTSEKAEDKEFLSMCVSVTRRKLSLEEAKSTTWRECSKPLVPLESLSEGLIEHAHGCLQVDFANAYIGGGVLGMGNVQEEIRFVINPECLVSILFCEEMNELESILITGAEQFSNYTGYGGRFKYTGPHTDTNPIDARRRRCVSIVAIDATPYSLSSSEEFQRQSVLRELNKAYSGFSCQTPTDDLDKSCMVQVATGNWGCGAFGGNRYLKTVIQWLAASRAGREVKYFTFTQDQEFSQGQTQLAEKLHDKNMTVGKLYQILVSSGISKESDVFEHICGSVV